MAIAFDKAGCANTGTNTATVTLAAAAANEVAIMVFWWNSSTFGNTFSSITVNGSSTGITQIGSEYTPADGQKMRAYYLYNPTTSSVNYTVTMTATGGGDGCMLGVGLYSGANSTQPDSSAFSSPTTPFNVSTTVVQSNCWLVSWARRFGGSTIGVDSGTSRASVANANIFIDSNGTVGTGSQSLSYSSDATNVLGFVMSLAPEGAAGPANLKSLDTNVKANIKSYNTNLLANIKSINTNA